MLFVLWFSAAALLFSAAGAVFIVLRLRALDARLSVALAGVRS
ncbi:MAG TPA: hypothetical protein VFJ15_06730 [Oleiagrimonas sp.]|nr:hypothetical protein [Oleiagrimonas sp.]